MIQTTLKHFYYFPFSRKYFKKAAKLYSEPKKFAYTPISIFIWHVYHLSVSKSELLLSAYFSNVQFYYKNNLYFKLFVDEKNFCNKGTTKKLS